MREFGKIPEEVFSEAEKFGVPRGDIVAAAASDRDADGTYCDNWILVTDREIVLVGGIQAVVPKTRRRMGDPRRLTVKFTKVSAKHIDRKKLADYRVDVIMSGCTLSARNSETGNSEIITFLTRDKEKSMEKLCAFLNGGEKPENGHKEKHHAGNAPMGHGGPGGPGEPCGPGGPGEPGGPGGGAGGRDADDDESDDGLYCPKCGRKYPDPNTRLCPHCVKRMSVMAKLMSFAKKYRMSVLATLVTMGLTAALGVISPYISSQFFYDQVLSVGGEFYGQVLLVIFMIAALRILSLLVEMLSIVITAKVVPKIVYDLKKTIFNSIERLSLSYFTNRHTGALMNQVDSDANTIYWFFVDGLPYFIVNFIQTVAVAIIMFVIDWRLSLIAVAFCPLAMLAVKWLFGVMHKLRAKSYSASRSMSGLLSDVLGGARVVKAFSREKEEISRFNVKSSDFALADRRSNGFESVMFPCVTFIFVISSVLVTGVGGWLVIDGSLTYGKLLSFLAYTSMLYSPLVFFVDITQSMTSCFNATYRLMEVMDAEPEVKECAKPIELENVGGSVCFENVTFGYDKSRSVINDVSIDAPAGSKIGIVGHTGAGKSTIANLLMRLYDPDKGRILIDGHDLRELSFDTLHKNIAIVSQESHLIPGTVLDNIRYAAPEATVDDVVSAAKAAGAHEFIVKLPDGYMTKLGWGHKELSGGERQRISIARAILRDPKILILDEATSAMDTRTERAIQASLEKLCRGRTTIMIAHRLSTLRDCEKLYVIEHGSVAESGTHAQLIRQKGIYFKLYTLQYEALKNAGVEE